MEHQDRQRKPSFLIADILSDKPLAKKSALVQKFPSLLYPVFHPAQLAAFSSFLYSDPYNLQYRGSDGVSVPVPLPVYVRTKSSGGDSFATPKKCRRSRTVFTELQLMGLEKKFETHKYLSTPDRSDLADCLGLSQIQVKTWYQNRRMKWKKQVLQRGGTQAPTKPKGRPKKISEADTQHFSEQTDITENS